MHDIENQRFPVLDRSFISIINTWQEVDLSSQTSTTFYAGAKKLLGKQNIYSLQVQKNVMFAGGSLVDGISGKVIHTFSLITNLLTKNHLIGMT